MVVTGCNQRRKQKGRGNVSPDPDLRPPGPPRLPHRGHSGELSLEQRARSGGGRQQRIETGTVKADKIGDRVLHLPLADSARPARQEMRRRLRRPSRGQLAIGREEKLLIGEMEFLSHSVTVPLREQSEPEILLMKETPSRGRSRARERFHDT